MKLELMTGTAKTKTTAVRDPLTKRSAERVKKVDTPALLTRLSLPSSRYGSINRNSPPRISPLFNAIAPTTHGSGPGTFSLERSGL